MPTTAPILISFSDNPGTVPTKTHNPHTMKIKTPHRNHFAHTSSELTELDPRQSIQLDELDPSLSLSEFALRRHPRSWQWLLSMRDGSIRSYQVLVLRSLKHTGSSRACQRFPELFSLSLDSSIFWNSWVIFLHFRGKCVLWLPPVIQR